MIDKTTLKSLILGVGIALTFQLCTPKKGENHKVELNPGMDSFLTGTKINYGIEDIHIRADLPTAGKDSLKTIHSILFNPQKSPEQYDELNLPNTIAQTVYQNLSYPTAYASLSIEYVYDKKYFNADSPYWTRKINFTLEELEKLTAQKESRP